MSFNIQLKEINDVYKLVNILVGFEGEVDLESGRYKVDGKSILGIFSLDLRQPIKLTYNHETGAEKLRAARNVKPGFIGTEGFYKVRVLAVDFPCLVTVFLIQREIRGKYFK